MVVGVALCAFALRLGLQLRRARLRRVRRPAELRRRHLRAAKLAVPFVIAGFAAGPPSMLFLRGRDPFETFHGWIGLLVTALFAAAAVLGRRLERHDTRSREAHAALGALAVLGAAVAAVAGFVLLP